MTVRTIHIREMLDQAQHLAGRAARLAAMAETTLPGMEKAQRTELERAIVLADRAAGLAEHAKAELRDELFRATHADDIDAHLLGHHHSWGGGERQDSPYRPPGFDGSWWQVDCVECGWRFEAPRDAAIEAGKDHAATATPPT